MTSRPRHHVVLCVLLCAVGLARPARAHFQTLLPTPASVTAESKHAVVLDLSFTHPMEQGPVMDMARPVRFGVLEPGKPPRDASAALTERLVEGKRAWRASIDVREPGDYAFYVEPAPYWEPAEGKYIVHYTKVVVDVLGGGDAWDASVGFPVEIQPLVRPYGLWTGNAFQGIVLADGKAVPSARIEVEYWNEGGKVAIPGDSYVTQVLKADAAGVFTYVMPRAGWWGFAALVESGAKRPGPNGKEAPVEQGGLIWVRALDMR